MLKAGTQSITSNIRSTRWPTLGRRVASSTGIIYVLGSGEDSAGWQHTVLQASGDGGSTWALVNDYDSHDGNRVAVTIDPTGNFYQTGSILLNGLTTWYTRRSADGGYTWNTVDQFTFNGSSAYPEGIATDPAGNVYLVGFTAGYPGSWIVRKGTVSIGGITWATVDQIAAMSTVPVAVVVHPAAGVLVTGRANSVWTTRRSRDGGATWQTVDSYQLSSSSQGSAICVDALGNIYAAGYASVGSKRVQYQNGIVRKSSDGGATWTTIDNFATPGANDSMSAIATDTNGNLYAAGTSSAGGGTWIVR